MAPIQLASGLPL